MCDVMSNRLENRTRLQTNAYLYHFVYYIVTVILLNSTTYCKALDN